MTMVAIARLIRPPPSRHDCGPRQTGRNEAIAASADQIGPAGFQERFAHLEMVFRLEVLQKRSLELAISQLPGRVHLLAGERVNAGLIHALGNIWGHLDIVQYAVATTGP
jgi:hypothetical protein